MSSEGYYDQIVPSLSSLGGQGVKNYGEMSQFKDSSPKSNGSNIPLENLDLWEIAWYQENWPPEEIYVAPTKN